MAVDNASASAAGSIEALDEAVALLRDARRLVIFTGAGVSAESGIDTFRGGAGGGEGLWSRFPPGEFATPMGLVKLLATDPMRVAHFLRALIEPVALATPNPAHVALAALEHKLREQGKDVVVITQNVDRLHQEAGSKRVLEIHGSLFEIVDHEGVYRRSLDRADLRRMVKALEGADRALFKRRGVARALAPLIGVLDMTPHFVLAHRPNVVLFGEALSEPAWQHARTAAEDADAMLVVGTSGAVYPAASLPEIAAHKGKPVVGVGPEPVDAKVWVEGKAGVVLPRLVDKLTR